MHDEHRHRRLQFCTYTAHPLAERFMDHDLYNVVSSCMVGSVHRQSISTDGW